MTPPAHGASGKEYFSVGKANERVKTGCGDLLAGLCVQFLRTKNLQAALLGKRSDSGGRELFAPAFGAWRVCQHARDLPIARFLVLRDVFVQEKL